MSKKSKPNQTHAAWLAALGIQSLDYAPLLARENWWTFELVSVVTGLPVPEVPEHPLAYLYDESFGDEDKNSRDYLENELRNSFDRRDPEIPIIQDSVEKNGHRSINRVAGLRFVQRHMDAINAKVTTTFDAVQRECELSRLRITEKLKRIVDLNERIKKRNQRVAKRKHEGKAPMNAILLPFIENYSVLPHTPEGTSWIEHEPRLLFIPDELRPLRDNAQNEAPGGPETDRPGTPGADADGGDEAENVVRYCPDTKTYEFKYEGLGVSVMKYVGWRYVCDLLRKPYEVVEATVIRDSDRPRTKDGRTKIAAFYEDNKGSNQAGRQNRPKRQRIPQELKEQVENLVSKAVEAKENGDETTAKLYKQQARDLVDPPLPKGERKKASDAIRKGVREVLPQIESRHSSLHKHLCDSIKFGRTLQYAPRIDPHWRFD